MKKVLTLLLSVIIVMSMQMNQVEASELLTFGAEDLSIETSVAAFDGIPAVATRATTFNDTTINVTCSSSGMFVSITTSMTKVASVVGVKDITVDRLINGNWVTVATSSGGEVYNTIGCEVSFTYSGAIYDETYRITCVHYANVDGYRELYHEADDIIFVY